MSAKLDHLIAQTKKAIEDNNCVVIALQNTGDAAAQRSGQTDAIPSVAADILKELLLDPKIFCTQGMPALQTLKDGINTKIYDIEPMMPKNPLDVLIDELGGPDKVAEMTGRQHRYVRSRTGKLEVKRRSKGDAQSDSVNIYERGMFQKGAKLVGIISDAASTGVSLHADRRCANQRRRVHITLQLPWSAEKAVQQFGRTHRSNQSSEPDYVVLLSAIPAESRFASAVGAKMRSLGALTKGDRSAAANRSKVQYHYFDLSFPARFHNTAPVVHTVWPILCCSMFLALIGVLSARCVQNWVSGPRAGRLCGWWQAGRGERPEVFRPADATQHAKKDPRRTHPGVPDRGRW